MVLTAAIGANIAEVRERVAQAAIRSGRRPEDVSILGATKTVSPEAIEAAMTAGINLFGENRVQEAVAKIPLVDNLAQALGPSVSGGPLVPTWHFIGHLQTNKARAAIERFDTIESVDSLRLAEALDRIAAQLDRRVPILIEVNTSGEVSKHGFLASELEAVAGQMSALAHLEIQGLMTIGPLESHLHGAREAFRSLRRLRDGLAAHYPHATWDTLSMGMSEDFEVAVEEGASTIRLGRAIFGTRA